MLKVAGSWGRRGVDKEWKGLSEGGAQASARLLGHPSGIGMIKKVIDWGGGNQTSNQHSEWGWGEGSQIKEPSPIPD